MAVMQKKTVNKSAKAAKTSKVTTKKIITKKRITLEPEGIVFAEKKSNKKAFTKKIDSVKARKEKIAPAKKNGEKRSKKEAKPQIKSFYALRLNYLPVEFEEPQLQRFLSQFGSPVSKCYCLRSKRNYSSLGTAFVQFENSAVIPTVIEECHGMLLGGRTIRARRVKMNKNFPLMKKIHARRLKALDIAARGIKMHRHNLGKLQKQAAANNIGAVVGYLIKYSKAEKKLNDRNKRELGIAYSFDGFAKQLKLVDKSHFKKPEKKKKETSKKQEN